MRFIFSLLALLLVVSHHCSSRCFDEKTDRRNALLINEINSIDAETPRLQKLLSDCGNINFQTSDGSSLLLHALRQGKLKVAHHLISHNADITLADKHGTTPLMIAAQRGYKDITERLIAKKIDLNTSDWFGTPLMHAIQSNNADIAIQLINAGANVSMAGNEGLTPLMLAVQQKKFELIRLCIEKGALVDAKDAQGKTALLYAIENISKSPVVTQQEEDNCYEIIRLLLKNNATPYIKDNYGRNITTFLHKNPHFNNIMAIVKEYQPVVIQNNNYNASYAAAIWTSILAPVVLCGGIILYVKKCLRTPLRRTASTGSGIINGY